MISQFDAERETVQRGEQRDESGWVATPILAGDQIAHSIDVFQQKELV